MHQLSAFLPAASGVIPYAAVLATKLLRSIAVLKESQKEEKMAQGENPVFRITKKVCAFE